MCYICTINTSLIILFFQPNINDLWAVDPDLARSLQFLLDYDGSVEEDIGTTFVSSVNPLQQNSTDSIEVVELKSGGRDIFVNKANRAEFVELFVQYALYFLSGWRRVVNFPVTKMCTDSEVGST